MTDKQLIGWLEFIKFEDDEDRRIADEVIKKLEELRDDVDSLRIMCGSIMTMYVMSH